MADDPAESTDFELQWPERPADPAVDEALFADEPEEPPSTAPTLQPPSGTAAPTPVPAVSGDDRTVRIRFRSAQDRPSGRSAPDLAAAERELDRLRVRMAALESEIASLRARERDRPPT